MERRTPLQVWFLDDVDKPCVKSIVDHSHLHGVFVCSKQAGRSKEWLAAQLFKQQPAMIWIALPGPPSMPPPKSYTLRLRAVMDVARRQLESGRHLVMEATRRNRCWTHVSTEEFVRPRAQSGQLRIVDMKVKDAAQHRIVSSSGLGVPPLRVESLDAAALVLVGAEQGQGRAL